jgi:antitoxin (DNA-binding transcriptional repressor) of toxin-antitoxin stability system
MKHTISITVLQRQMRSVTTGLIRGDEYTLMRNGKPLATITPVPEGSKLHKYDPTVVLPHEFRDKAKPFRPLPPAVKKLQEEHLV